MGRPRRAVQEHPLGFSVNDGEFVTTDRTLATAVAAQLDRLDPLVCTHETDNDLIEVTAVSDPARVYMRNCCGEIVDAE